MKWSWTVFLLVGVVLNQANAYDTFLIPEGDEREAVIFKNNLPDTTLVQNSYFSVLVPKGWSVFVSQADEQYKLSVSASPSQQLKKDVPYISVHVKRAPSTKSLHQRQAELAKQQQHGEKLYFATWRGHRWLVYEYPRKVGKENAKAWTAWTIANGRDILLVAAVPNTLLSSVESQVKGIMQSAAFRPKSAVDR
jgi:hypothetical protein